MQSLIMKKAWWEEHEEGLARAGLSSTALRPISIKSPIPLKGPTIFPIVSLARDQVFRHMSQWGTPHTEMIIEGKWKGSLETWELLEA